MNKFIALLFVLCIAGLGACVYDADFMSGDEGGETGFTVSDARECFEDNAEALNLPSMLFKSSEGNATTRNGHFPQVPLTPNWRKAKSYRSPAGDLEIVDTPASVDGEMVVRRYDISADGEILPYRSLTEKRLVQVMSEDGNVRMFLMTLVPDASGYHKPAKNTRYMHPKNDFSGLAIFSDPDGGNCEVWEYNNGARVREMVCHASGLRPAGAENPTNERIILRTSLSLRMTRGDGGDGDGEDGGG